MITPLPQQVVRVVDDTEQNQLVLFIHIVSMRIEFKAYKLAFLYIKNSQITAILCDSV